jgi:hypothetical protein
MESCPRCGGRKKIALICGAAFIASRIVSIALHGSSLRANCDGLTKAGPVLVSRDSMFDAVGNAVIGAGGE